MTFDHKAEKANSFNILNIGEKRMVMEGFEGLLLDLTNSPDLGLAMSTILTTLETLGIRIPDKLYSLDAQAPVIGKYLGATLLIPREDGMPYIATDVKIFKPTDSELVSISYRDQNSDMDPALIEKEIVGPYSLDASTPFSITTRTRQYDHQTKWQSPLEQNAITSNEVAILEELKSLALDSLNKLS